MLSTPGVFKKMVSIHQQKKDNNTVSVELRYLWIVRMKENEEEFRKAAMSWAGINNRTLGSEGINPFWKGVNPPSIISLPHIATQALLALVFSTLFYSNLSSWFEDSSSPYHTPTSKGSQIII
jgi:hypothetical protein